MEGDEVGVLVAVPVVPAVFAAEAFVLAGCFGALTALVHDVSIQHKSAKQANSVKIFLFINQIFLLH